MLATELAEAGQWPNSQCLRSCHLFDRIGDAVLVAELPSTRIALWNATASHMFGYSEGEAARLHLDDLVPEWSSRTDRAHAHAVSSHPGLPSEARPVELHGRHKDGRDIEIEANFGSLESGGSSGAFMLVILRDITERKRSQASLSDQAFHDPLTGLPNRLLLTDRFRQAVLSARRAGSTFAVLMLDIDGFKQINDQLGHIVGDAVLQQIARRLRTAVRESDTVARLGGDEFVLLSMAERDGGAEAIVKRVLRALGRPMTIGRRTVHVRASIGVTLFPEHGADMESLIERADAAMYRAKRRGGGYELFAGATARMPSAAARLVAAAPVAARLPSIRVGER